MVLQAPNLMEDDIVPYFEMHRGFQSRPRKRREMKPTFKGIIAWHLAALCYQLCQTVCSGDSSFQDKLLVDLSYEFNEETIYWVTSKPLFLNVTHNGTTEQGYWYQSEEISAATHGGTHLDAPCHLAKGGWCVSEIPLEHLVTSAVVVDISDHVQHNPSVHLSKDHLLAWEEIHGQIPKKALLLVRTGWARFWPNRLDYMGTNERNVSLLKFPSVTPDAAQWIVDNRDIVGLGIDSISVDAPGPTRPKVHRILAGNNIYNLENVNNELRLLPPRGATVYVFPMKLKGASGAPCRILATVDKNHSKNSAQCCRLSCSSSVIIAFAAYLAYVVYKTSALQEY